MLDMETLIKITNLQFLKLCNMLQIIVGIDTDKRIEKRNSIFAELKSEVIILDDTNTTNENLEEYIYPSLFSIGTPVVHGKFILENGPIINKDLIQKLVASPTFFILEELSIASPILKNFEKEGAIVHQYKTISSPQTNTIFEVTNALTAQGKKDRWLAWQKAKIDNSAEALIGILYWKLKQLIDKNSKDINLKRIYQSLMKAQKNAWQRGTPLDLAIEKVILKI
jgi:hypothetical protein